MTVINQNEEEEILEDRNVLMKLKKILSPGLKNRTSSSSSSESSSSDASLKSSSSSQTSSSTIESSSSSESLERESSSSSSQSSSSSSSESSHQTLVSRSFYKYATMKNQKVWERKFMCLLICNSRPLKPAWQATALISSRWVQTATKFYWWETEHSKNVKKINISDLLFQTKYPASNPEVHTLYLDAKVIRGNRVGKHLAASLQLNKSLSEMQVVIATQSEEHSWGLCIRGLIVRGQRLVVEKKSDLVTSLTQFNIHCIIYCFKSFSGQARLGEHMSSVHSQCHGWEVWHESSCYYAVAKTSKLFDKPWRTVKPLFLLWLQYICITCITYMAIFGYYM